MPDVIPAGQGWVSWLAVLVALLAPTIAVIVNGKIANDNANKAAKLLTTAAETTNAKLDRIDSMVDGRLSEAQKKIERLENELRRDRGDDRPNPKA